MGGKWARYPVRTVVSTVWPRLAISSDAYTQAVPAGDIWPGGAAPCWDQEEFSTKYNALVQS